MLQAEKRGLDETARRSEAQIKQQHTERDTAQAQLDRLEERCRELQKQRDASQRERARAQEQLAIATAESRSAT